MLKRFLPRSLFGRFLLIVVTPVVLLQLISGAVFFERHLDSVSRRMARAVAGDIAYLVESVATFADAPLRARILELATANMNLSATYLPGAVLPEGPPFIGDDEREDVLVGTLLAGIGREFRIEPHPEWEAYVIHVPVEGGLLRVHVPYNRFTSATAHLVVFWTLGSSLLLLAIAILFLRNQIRPIRQLARAADGFGKGQPVGDFRPSGATEVRQAAAAFLVMRDRIERQIRQRTEMLAGVSHDLRTPLTRMRLSLAMLGDGAEVEEMRVDVREMEQMIDGYLAFARGARGEEAVETDVAALLGDVAEDARRHGAQVDLRVNGDMLLRVRPQALKRCVANLVDNARRYARHTRIDAQRLADQLLIVVDDDGPGIPPEQREEVFRPFFRMDSSRNRETGGVGLGLAIARDTIRSHGGDVTLDQAPEGGLRALVRLPV